MSETQNLSELMKILGHQFKDLSLLEEAITHTSMTKGRRKQLATADYERLEFLGDRVLGLVIADELFARYPTAEAGQLSRRFNSQVRRETLAEIAEDMGLHKFIRVSSELSRLGGEKNPSLMEDCMEAVIAALYLDGGMTAAMRCIKDHWWSRFEQENAARKDPKSALQEWAAKQGKANPEYRLIEEAGPDHNRTFTIEVHLDGYQPAMAKGQSKRAAEKQAAAKMLKEHANE